MSWCPDVKNLVVLLANYNIAIIPVTNMLFNRTSQVAPVRTASDRVTSTKEKNMRTKSV